MLVKGEDHKGMSQDTGRLYKLSGTFIHIHSHKKYLLVENHLNICRQYIQIIQTIYIYRLCRQHKQTLYRDIKQIRVPC